MPNGIVRFSRDMEGGSGGRGGGTCLMAFAISSRHAMRSISLRARKTKVSWGMHMMYARNGAGVLWYVRPNTWWSG